MKLVPFLQKIVLRLQHHTGAAKSQPSARTAKLQLDLLSGRDAPSSILVADLNVLNGPVVGCSTKFTDCQSKVSLPASRWDVASLVRLTAPGSLRQPSSQNPSVKLPESFAPIPLTTFPDTRWFEPISLDPPVGTQVTVPPPAELQQPVTQSPSVSVPRPPETQVEPPKAGSFPAIASNQPKPTPPTTTSFPVPTPSLVVPPRFDGAVTGSLTSEPPRGDSLQLQVAIDPGSVMHSDTPVFRITNTAKCNDGLVLPYTLSAHDSTGTESRTGTATLTGSLPSALVTSGGLLAGRAAELLTLSQPDGRFNTATLFAKPVQQLTDSTLFEAHRVSRSVEAFQVLVQRHQARVTRLSERVVRNRADAEDVGQFVFLELARFQHRFPGSMVGWLNTVARNASLTFLRSKRRRMHHEVAAARPLTADSPIDLRLDETLATALRQLPTELGEAVRLRYVDGYTQEEAAVIAGVPRGTLSRRAASGLRVLRGWLACDPAMIEMA